MQSYLHRPIYLSPHLDDAVLSCGGSIYDRARRGEGPLVVTVFAASPPDASLTPFTRELWERWGGADDPVAARRAEDLAALATLGAQGLHLPYLDCVYRQHPVTGEALYPTVEHIFADVHPAETPLANVIHRALSLQLSAHGLPQVYAPLGAGHHVDHQMLRQVAARLAADGADCTYYEDWPYAGDAEAVSRALGSDAGRWRRYVAPLGEKALAAKGDAAAHYASQISTFWPDAEAMRQALREQAGRVGSGGLGEGFWSPAPPRSGSAAVGAP